jgi:hypothetical protein
MVTAENGCTDASEVVACSDAVPLIVGATAGFVSTTVVALSIAAVELAATGSDEPPATGAVLSVEMVATGDVPESVAAVLVKGAPGSDCARTEVVDAAAVKDAPGSTCAAPDVDAALSVEIAGAGEADSKGEDKPLEGDAMLLDNAA